MGTMILEGWTLLVAAFLVQVCHCTAYQLFIIGFVYIFWACLLAAVKMRLDKQRRKR